MSDRDPFKWHKTWEISGKRLLKAKSQGTSELKMKLRAIANLKLRCSPAVDIQHTWQQELSHSFDLMWVVIGESTTAVCSVSGRDKNVFTSTVRHQHTSESCNTNNSKQYCHRTERSRVSCFCSLEKTLGRVHHPPKLSYPPTTTTTWPSTGQTKYCINRGLKREITEAKNPKQNLLTSGGGGFITSLNFLEH